MVVRTQKSPRKFPEIRNQSQTCVWRERTDLDFALIIDLKIKSLSVKGRFAYILPILLADISNVHPEFGANRYRKKQKNNYLQIDPILSSLFW